MSFPLQPFCSTHSSLLFTNAFPPHWIMCTRLLLIYIKQDRMTSFSFWQFLRCMLVCHFRWQKSSGQSAYCCPIKAEALPQQREKITYVGGLEREVHGAAQSGTVFVNEWLWMENKWMKDEDGERWNAPKKNNRWMRNEGTSKVQMQRRQSLWQILWKMSKENLNKYIHRTSNTKGKSNSWKVPTMSTKSRILCHNCYKTKQREKRLHLQW